MHLEDKVISFISSIFEFSSITAHSGEVIGSWGETTTKVPDQTQTLNQFPWYPPPLSGSGCSNPGPPADGTSSMNEDGSWAVFGCNSGFRLHGPSMLYCKGHTWNSTKPVCKGDHEKLSATKAILWHYRKYTQEFKVILLSAKEWVYFPK